jgi:hypothetical protein
MILRQILWSLWLFGIPRQPIALVTKYPATIVCVGCFLSAPERPKIGLILIALFFDLLTDSWQSISAIAAGQEDILRFLVANRDCSYREWTLERILTPPQMKFVRGTSIFDFLGRRLGLYDHNKDLRILEVEIGQEGCLRDSMVAFHVPFLRSYVFIRDSPTFDDALTRFRLCHEISHTLGLQFVRQAMEVKQAKSLLLAVAVAACLLSHSVATVALLGLTVLLFVVCAQALALQAARTRFVNELEADRQGIDLLDEKQRLALTAIYARRSAIVIPRDRALTGSQQRIRECAFHDRLSRATDLEGWDEFLHEQLGEMRHLNSIGASLALALLVLGSGLRQFSPSFLWWLVGTVSTLWVLLGCRYLRYYVRGFAIEFILNGRLAWRAGTFRFPDFDRNHWLGVFLAALERAVNDLYRQVSRENEAKQAITSKAEPPVAGALPVEGLIRQGPGDSN